MIPSSSSNGSSCASGPNESPARCSIVFDHHLQQTCALKLLNRTVFGVWTEAQVLNRLHGEHVLPMGNADLAQGVPYLATEGTVADQNHTRCRRPIATAVRWARQACQGVARVHPPVAMHQVVSIVFGSATPRSSRSAAAPLGVIEGGKNAG